MYLHGLLSENLKGIAPFLSLTIKMTLTCENCLEEQVNRETKTFLTLASGGSATIEEKIENYFDEVETIATCNACENDEAPMQKNLQLMGGKQALQFVKSILTGMHHFLQKTQDSSFFAWMTYGWLMEK